MAVQLQLLGVPRLECDGRVLPVSWQRRSLSLLTYLFTARGLVTREAAAFALWPDEDEEEARGNLRRNLNLLRAVLPPAAAQWITVDPGSLAFDRLEANTDVAEFERLASDATSYAEAVGRYGGDFAEPLSDPWVLVERERLRVRFHTVLAKLGRSQFLGAALRRSTRVRSAYLGRRTVSRRRAAARHRRPLRHGDAGPGR